MAVTLRTATSYTRECGRRYHKSGTFFHSVADRCFHDRRAAETAKLIRRRHPGREAREARSASRADCRRSGPLSSADDMHQSRPYAHLSPE
jgi:hypothetical protein